MLDQLHIGSGASAIALVLMPGALAAALLATPIASLAVAGVITMYVGAFLAVDRSGAPEAFVVLAAGIIMCGMAGGLWSLRRAR